MKKAITKKTTTKKTAAKTTTTKTKKKGLSLKAQAAKRAQVHRNRSAGSKKGIKKLKAAKKGLFAPKTLSASLAAICGAKKLSNVEVTKAIWKYIKAKKLSNVEVTKAIWKYIKAKKLNDGRIIKPDDKMKAVFPV